jgi:hypothetical protein
MTKFVRCYDCSLLKRHLKLPWDIDKKSSYGCRIFQSIYMAKKNTYEPWNCHTFIQVDPVMRAKQELTGEL